MPSGGCNVLLLTRWQRGSCDAVQCRASCTLYTQNFNLLDKKHIHTHEHLHLGPQTRAGMNVLGTHTETQQALNKWWHCGEDAEIAFCSVKSRFWLLMFLFWSPFKSSTLKENRGGGIGRRQLIALKIKEQAVSLVAI